ncbi:hypothetical protein B5807_03675 [Epicoccum nigrum]|uniref:Uncharacterized protein n=1 Tax=Epicoccum nigrum TaxID=105696 RepID=A0A1Y2M7M5_EPING|nr:hypothetical protein B5807_03675 [Epicoccum nigrum]
MLIKCNNHTALGYPRDWGASMPLHLGLVPVPVLLLLALLVPISVLVLLQHLMREIGHGLAHGLLCALLCPRLVHGVMSEEGAHALAQDVAVLVDAWVAHGIIAGDLDDLVAAGVVVPADVLGEGLLLVAPVLLPVAAPRVLLLVGAFLPRLKHLKCVGQRLRNDDAGVEDEFALAVVGGVFVAVEDLSCVEWHGDGGLGFDAPAVEQPFDGELEVLDGCVGVNEDDEFIGFEELGEDVGLHPGVVVAIGLHGARVEELVIVAVDLSLEEMVHKRCGDHAAVFLGVHGVPIHALCIPELVIAVGHAGIDVDDEDLIAQRLLPPRAVFVDLVLLPRRILIHGRRHIGSDRLVKLQESLIHRHISFLLMFEHVSSPFCGAARCVLDLLHWIVAMVNARGGINKNRNEEEAHPKRGDSMCGKDRPRHLVKKSANS